MYNLITETSAIQMLTVRQSVSNWVSKFNSYLLLLEVWAQASLAKATAARSNTVTDRSRSAVLISWTLSDDSYTGVHIFERLGTLPLFRSILWDFTLRISMLIVFQSRKLLYNHQCLFIPLSVSLSVTKTPNSLKSTIIPYKHLHHHP